MSKPVSTSGAPKPKNWLLAKSRQWHLWGGLFAGLLITVAGASGIVLNYKKPVFTALGLEQDTRKDAKEEMASTKGKPKAGSEKSSSLTTDIGTGPAAAGIMDRALELARAEWGNEARLERIEVKSEHGELLCKVKHQGGDELWMYPAAGTHFIKGEYDKIKKSGPDGAMTREFDWGKLLLNLHTGKIGGDIGIAIMSLAALMLVFLTASGVYMWAKPILIRRQNAKARAAVVPVVAKPVAASLPQVETAA